MPIRELFRFPHVVNETAARLVAALVALSALFILATGQRWLIPLVCFGFLLRVLAGPRLSPAALLVTRVLVPRLGLPGVPVAGAPKRFAQGIGLVLTAVASVLVPVGPAWLVTSLVAALAVASTLEALFGLCVGCRLYALLVRAGVFTAPVGIEGPRAPADL